ncbi:MAG: hypothetical protein QNM02_10935, partial [Acidimicrobiia bacterium]|nr:hypothetical protein [Acidimicrobiia bacterium]
TVPLDPGGAGGGAAGRPVAVGGEGDAAERFRALARRLVAEVAPPSNRDEVDMAGCSARLLESVESAFAELDARL